jgi:hypothetical protein
MGDSEATVGAEEDDAAVAAEAIEQVGNGFAGGELRGGPGSDAVGGPFAKDELHDWFAPAGERNGGGEIVGITTAPDEGGVPDAAWSFIQSTAC